MKKILLSLFCVVLLAFTGCGYHLGSVPPAGVTSIYIPIFENITHRQELTSDVTDGVIKRFKTDGTVKITDEKNADAILHGKITSYQSQAVLFDAQDVGEEFRVTIHCDVTLTSTETGKVIFSGNSIDGEAVTKIMINQAEAEKRVFPIIVNDLSKNVVEAVLESAW